MILSLKLIVSSSVLTYEALTVIVRRVEEAWFIAFGSPVAVGAIGVSLIISYFALHL